MNLTPLKKQVDRILADARSTRVALNASRRDVRESREAVRTAKEAQKVVQRVAELVQQRTHASLAAIVTRCLQAVFGPTCEFKVEFEQKRGKTEARLLLLEGGLELDPQADECAGGVLDVAAFALRLACLVLQRPVRRRLLVLDEPFRFVSERKDYRERVRLLLLQLSEEMEVQIVLVTHSRELEIGKVVEL